MDLELLSQAEDVADIRHRVRQLRWFKTTFKQHARLIAGRYGVPYEIDDGRLTEAFLNWAEAFSQDLGYSDLDRRDFITFAAGLLVRELLRSAPASAGAPTGEAPRTADATGSIARSWPEGFLYTNYCLCVLHIVLEQEGVRLTLPTLADDLRTWWSYRENVGDDASLAIPFFDLLTGNEPNWYFPASVVSRRAVRRAIERRIVPKALTNEMA
jgi:hypothetical protein